MRSRPASPPFRACKRIRAVKSNWRRGVPSRASSGGYLASQWRRPLRHRQQQPTSPQIMRNPTIPTAVQIRMFITHLTFIVSVGHPVAPTTRPAPTFPPDGAYNSLYSASRLFENQRIRRKFPCPPTRRTCISLSSVRQNGAGRRMRSHFHASRHRQRVQERFGLPVSRSRDGFQKGLRLFR